MHMAAAETFQDLIVWQKSRQFVLQIYRHSANFTSQRSSALHNSFAARLFRFPPTSPKGSRGVVELTKRGS